ncbi:MAG: hypothetical protein IT531_01900 [Burkholderiales bacterium]|nr:hypothetical protein [Burkholderiales bacterium]
MIEHLFEGARRKFTIGILDKLGAAGESISSWLDNGRLTLAQARAIAGQWEADRQAGRDPIAEWEARLGARRAADEEQRKAIALEAAQPTVREAVAILQGLQERTGKKRHVFDRPCERTGRYSDAASTMRWAACSSAAYSAR